MKNKIPKYEDKIRQVIRDVVKEMGRHPFDINDGYCEEFAYIVNQRLPQAKIDYNDIESDDSAGHVFLSYHGRFYDAEELMGVKDYHDLPLFYRHKLLNNGRA